MYICFVTLHGLWSGNKGLYFSSVGILLLFVIRMLSSVLIIVVSSIRFLSVKNVAMDIL